MYSPSLAVLATCDEAITMLTSEDWMLEEKADGRRIMMQKTDDIHTFFADKFGVPTRIPAHTPLPSLPPDTIMDFEFLVSTRTWVALDVLRWNGEDWSSRTGLARYRFLLAGIDWYHGFDLIECAWTLGDKASLLAELKARKAEGIIFKKSAAPYHHGLIQHGGPIYKYPWRKRMDVILRHRPDGKRAFTMSAFWGGAEIEIGHVSARHFYEQLPAGSVTVAEVEYLYSSRKARLVQPTIIRLRKDKTPEQCLINQMQIGGRHAVK